jgi:hypothetical protein
MYYSIKTAESILELDGTGTYLSVADFTQLQHNPVENQWRTLQGLNAYHRVYQPVMVLADADGRTRLTNVMGFFMVNTQCYAVTTDANARFPQDLKPVNLTDRIYLVERTSMRQVLTDRVQFLASDHAMTVCFSTQQEGRSFESIIRCQYRGDKVETVIDPAQLRDGSIHETYVLSQHLQSLVTFAGAVQWLFSEHFTSDGIVS